MYEDTLPKVLMKERIMESVASSPRYYVCISTSSRQTCVSVSVITYICCGPLSFSLLNFIQIYFHAVLGQRHFRHKSSMSSNIHHL